MRDELVPVSAHRLDFLLKCCLVYVEIAQQSRLECRAVGNDLSPKMLSTFVGEELAPFQHAHINEIAVGCAPEVDQKLTLALSPTASRCRKSSHWPTR